MRILPMLYANTSKARTVFFCVLCGIYIAAVLWITLFSRIGSWNRAFLYPFHSYVQIIKGKWSVIIQNIENVILFIPLGIAVGSGRKLSYKNMALCGLVVSLMIELLQFTFALGTFECDDLLHNTIGCIIGYRSVEKAGIQLIINRRTFCLTLALIILCSAMPFGYLAIRHQKMIQLASLYDTENGIKNMLVLKGNSGRVGNTDIQIVYEKNGSMHIIGKTDNDVWCIISSDFILPAGTYTASVLGSSPNELVKFKLSRYEKQLGKFKWFSDEFDCNTENEFSISKLEKVRVYLRIGPGFRGECELVPVIYESVSENIE